MLILHITVLHLRRLERKFTILQCRKFGTKTAATIHNIGASGDRTGTRSNARLPVMKKLFQDILKVPTCIC